MNVFLAMVGKRGPISAAFIETSLRLADTAIPFNETPHRVDSWVSDQRNLALFAWSNDLRSVARNNLIYQEGPVAATLAGYITEPGVPNGHDVGSVVQSLGIDSDQRPSLGGIYALLLADQRRGSLTVWNMASRFVPVYWTETDDAILISTRAVLLSLIRSDSHRPSYDVSKFLPFLTVGFFASEDTPFTGVNVMPPNSELRAEGGGIQITPIDDFDLQLGLTRPDDAYYDELATLMTRTVGAFGDTPIVCSLTGGKDSRIVAAALHAAGLDFSTVTAGFPRHPDVLVAKRLSEELGVEHRVTTPALNKRGQEEVMELDLFERTSKSLFAHDGMVYAYHSAPVSQELDGNHLRVGGAGGESLRGGLAQVLNSHSRDRVIRFLEKRHLSTSTYFSHPAVEEYRRFLHDWVDRLSGVAPTQALDKFHLYYYTGRWACLTNAARNSELVYEPLLDNAVVKVAMRAEERAKLNEDLLYQLLLRLAPALADVPFYHQRWAFEKHGPVPGAEARWLLRSPLELSEVLSAASDTRESFEWRYAYRDGLHDAFYEQIFHNPQSDELFTIVDRDRLQLLFQQGDPTVPERSLVKLVWSVYTASVLLTNDWLPPRGSGTISTIKLPPARRDEVPVGDSREVIAPL